MPPKPAPMIAKLNSGCVLPVDPHLFIVYAVPSFTRLSDNTEDKMRSIATIAVFLFNFIVLAPSAHALEKGLYVITKSEFVGEQVLIDAARQAPFVGDLIRQLEAGGDNAHFSYDPATSVLTTYAPGTVRTSIIDEDAQTLFENGRVIADLVELTDTGFTMQLRELPDSIPFDFQISLEMVAPDDASVQASLNAIEAFERAKEAERLAIVKALAAPAPTGVRVGLPDTTLGIVLPVAFKYAQRNSFDQGIVRHAFSHEDAALSGDFFIYEVPDAEVLNLVKNWLRNEYQREVRYEDDRVEYGSASFAAGMLMAQEQVGDRFFLAFAKADSEAIIFEWNAIASTLDQFEALDAPDLADLFTDLDGLASLGISVDLPTGAIDACQQALPVFTKIEEFTKTASPMSKDLFSSSSFAALRCDIQLGQGDDVLAMVGDVRSDFPGFDALAAAENVQTLFKSDNALVIAEAPSMSRLKALRVIDIDGLTAVLEASPQSVSAAHGFLQATGTLDTAGLKIPDSWRRHVGAFRSLLRLRDTENFYEYTMDEDPFLEGILAADGTIITEPIHDQIKPVSGGFVLVDKAGLEGVITETGETLLPVQYNSILPKSDDLLLLYRTDNKQQVYDLKTRTFIGPQFDNIEFVKGETLVMTRLGDVHQIMGFDMEPALEGAFESVRYLTGGGFLVRREDKSGLIDTTGTELIPIVHDRLWPHFKHRLISARIGKKSAYYSYQGKRITPEGLDAMYAPSDPNGHITVKDDQQRYGVVDRHGNILIEPKYRQLHQFREGYIPARKGTGPDGSGPAAFGLIDEDETVILPFAYDNLQLVYGDRIWARKEGLWGLIDLEQKQIVDFTYGAIGRFREIRRHDTKEDQILSVARKGSMYGVIQHDTGEVVVPFEYTDAKPQFFELFKDNAWLRYPFDFAQN